MIFLIYPALMIMISGSLITRSQTKDTYNCTIEVKSVGNEIEICAQRNVIGVRGEDVVLPCLFKHNKQSTLRNLHLLFVKDKWIKKNPKQNLVYNSSSKYTLSDFEERIEPVGNTSSGNGSLQIRNLRMEDERTYVCRFEWTNAKGREEGFETRHTRRPKLHVDVRPKILNIEFDLNPWRLVCKAEAKPSPNIMWLNPRESRVVGSKITVGTITHQDNIQTVSFFNLTEDDPEGTYTCLVKNKYGNVTGNVIFNIPSIHPEILRIQSDLNSYTSWGLVCEAKAKPSPNITWLNPQGHLINEGEATVVAMDQNKIRYLSFLNRTEDNPEGNYTCLVKNKDGNTTRNVTFDIPSIHPKILRIQSDLNSSTSWGLVCQAKAKPSPNITWLNPQGHLINEGEATVVAMDQNKIRYVSFLNRTEDDPEGNYTCLVKNKDGNTAGNVIFDIPFLAPKILRIWKEFVNSSNSWRLFCETKAKPAPNITLWNPKGDFMVEVSVDQNYPNKLQQIIGDYNITEEDPPGNYSCLVMNIHGTAREYILYEGAGRKNSITTVVAWSTSLCLVLLFIIGIYIYRKKWKPQEGCLSDQNANEEEEVTYAVLSDRLNYYSPAPISARSVDTPHSMQDDCVYAVIKR